MKMRRSKLESYEDILGVVIREPLNIDNIAYETNMDCGILRQRLGFLIKNGLVKERILGKKRLYAITERGAAVLKTLDFQKYLEKVANTVRMMDDAVHIIPIISDDAEEKKKKAKENENY